jgi:cysteine synthase
VKNIRASALEAIGNTPLVELHRVVPPGCARILVKVEGQNPTGSMKDRMALAVIRHAEQDGRLPPGGAVVEYTGGSTGASLALVCALTGHPLHIVTSDAFSADKLTQMAAFGAELTVIPSGNGLITKALITQMIETAEGISQQTGAYWTNQLSNADSIEGYFPMGEEIWDQTGGMVSAFTHSIGTSASLQGVATVLRRHHPGVRIAAVEPGESAVLSGGAPGAHRIEGIGVGYVPPLWNSELVDEIVPVPTADAEAMARRLTSQEGLFAGTSSGANVIAAIRVGKRLGPGATVVTLLVDSGLKYLSTDVYRHLD